MESSKIFSKLFNIIFPFTDFLYILQQEEYSLQRVWFWLPRFFFRRNIQKRDKLVYTNRTKITLFLSVVVLVFLLSIAKNIILFIITILCIPLIAMFVNFLLNPMFVFFKKRAIKKAVLYFKNVKGSTKVIAITGSCGKTTVKNFIEQLVKASYKTQMIPGNINSTDGIASWILNNYQTETEVLIVEMDSYVPKGISESANLIIPDIAIITNVGDQHIERYKTKMNLSRSLFELFESSPKSSLRITNNETLNYLKEQNFNTENITLIKDNDSYGFLSVSNNKNLHYALAVADILKIKKEYIDHISKNIVLPERRQSKRKLFGFDGIDDSYNISFNTASAGIIEAFKQSKEKNKKLLVITAGIPELGPTDQDKNSELGKLLDKKADKVFILESIYYKEIISGIGDKEKIVCFKNFKEAVQILQKSYNTEEYFVLIQPELTDLYY